MYKLPKNITGYDAKRFEVNEFSNLCYSLQGLGVFEVSSIKGYDYPKNYYVANVSDKGMPYQVLVNCFTGVMGLGIEHEDGYTFIDNRNVEDALMDLNNGYEFLSSEILTSELGKDALSNLDKLEASEVRRWMPATYGEVLFSWFFD